MMASMLADNVSTSPVESATNPNLIYDLRAKLDTSGHYDDCEVERVVQVELNPRSTQGDLIAAIGPVADRLLKPFTAARAAVVAAEAQDDARGAAAAVREGLLGVLLGPGQLYGALRARGSTVATT
jgi:type I restriction enzyme R subunit